MCRLSQTGVVSTTSSQTHCNGTNRLIIAAPKLFCKFRREEIAKERESDREILKIERVIERERASPRPDLAGLNQSGREEDCYGKHSGPLVR